MPQVSAIAAAIVLASAACVAPALAGSITLNPSKDNTLVESPTGAFSNGLGNLFCGKTGKMAGFSRLRAVMAFDVAGGIPAGASIVSATLTLQLAQSSGGAQLHSLHTLTADWGEGTSLGLGGSGAPSTPNDATWIHGFYNTQFWNTPGGDFIASVSAVQTVGPLIVTDYSWSSQQMANDVQNWLDNPASNFGWIMLGNEQVDNSAKRFRSGEDPDPNLRPRLLIEYNTSCVGNIVTSGTSAEQVDVDDLLAVISAWGICPVPPATCPANIVNAGVSANRVDVDDLLAVISGWGPCK